MNTDTILHPIGYVARRTGLTTHVIRVWEFRYSAIEPTRTETNRRLYTDQDIERLTLLKAATANGHSISSVASLPDDTLRSILRNAKPTSDDPNQELPNPGRDVEHYLAICKKTIPSMNRALLESTLRDASAALSTPFFLEQLVVPLMRWVGDEWHEGNIRVAHEHFASAVVRDALYRFGFQDNDDRLPAVIICTPSGNEHEIGALLAASAAVIEGWRVVYLGANTPIHEISFAANDQDVRAVGLSATYTDDPGRLVTEMTLLRKLISPSCPIFIGGSGAGPRAEAFQQNGVQYIADLKTFRTRLRETLENSGVE